ncbi:hypothetical protein [Heyndrickxia coagulans]|nr:hypothetical protein [Heyndrickxia faecalis]QPG55210.1 hypothetical protein IR208_13765 [Heyndrickxia coagulans]WNE63302.1 hypothetical protein KIY57_14230 [Heyndrickxia coagulans]
MKSTFPVFLYMTSMSTYLIPGLEEINYKKSIVAYVQNAPAPI